MKEPGLDNRHRDKNGQISRKHGDTLIDTLHVLNETSLSQLHRDHDTGHLGHKIAKAS